MAVVLDPDAVAVYKAFQEAGRPAYETLTPPEAREYYMQARLVANPEPPELLSAESLAIPAPHGRIPARIYTPKKLRKADGLAPGLVFFHGGGWVIGNLETHDVVCRKLAHEGEMIVMSVDYRLAPEHRFPAAVEDAVTATKWLAANAKALGVDASRLVVGGDSAGGNLAAVVALLARGAGGPRLRLQSLVYPVTDYGLASDSYDKYASGYGILTRAAMVWFRDHYLRSVDDASDWRASPIRTVNLARVAPAIVITAECDVLHDDGERYANALRGAGVPVEYKEFPGMIHAFFGMVPAVDDAMNAQRMVWAAFKRAFAQA